MVACSVNYDVSHSWPHLAALRCAFVFAADAQSVSSPSESRDRSAVPTGRSPDSKLQVDQRDEVWGPTCIHTITLLLDTSVRLQYGTLCVLA